MDRTATSGRHWPGPVVQIGTIVAAGHYTETLLHCGEMASVPSVMGSVRPPGALQQQVLALGAGTFSLHAEDRGDYPAAIVRMARWLKAINASIVHAHELEAILVGLSAGRLAGIPVTVYTAHHSSEIPFHGRKLALAEWIFARGLADHVIVPSRQIGELIRDRTGVPAAHVEVVPHGFDQRQWQPTEAGRARVRAELGIDRRLVFGAVGRLFPLKNYGALIEGFASATADRPDAQLVIVGDGDQAGLARLAADLGVGERVSFTGQRADIRDVYAAFDVFVHPSLAETFGMAIVEAMLMGVPTLSAPVGIAPEVIVPGVSGLLLAPGGSPATIAAGLSAMLDLAPRWPALGAAGRQAAARYTDVAMANAYAALYRQWLGITADAGR